MNRRIISLLTILLILLAAISACGRTSDTYINSEGNEINDIEASETTIITGSANTWISEQDELLLTIAAGPIWLAELFTTVGNTLIEKMAEEGIALTVEVISYINYNERDSYFAQILSKLASGAGPDIIIRDNFPIYQFIENGFFVDIFTLIDQSSNMDRDDFFINILDGYAIDGRLYVLPVQFGFDFIGINANVPQEYINRFAALDRASLSDIISIYDELVDSHPEWGEFAIISSFHESMAIAQVLDRNIDFFARSATLTNDITIAWLDYVRLAFENNPTFDTPGALQMTYENMELLQGRYVFHYINDNPIEALFEHQEPFFTGYLPWADENGRLFNGTQGVEFSVSQNANLALAWAFIEQFFTDMWSGDDFRGTSAPIMQNYFRKVLETGLNNDLAGETRTLLYSNNIAIENAVSKFERHINKPFVQPIENFILPQDAFFDLLRYISYFLSGNTSAEETAIKMENSINSWLNEERIIVQYQGHEEVSLDEPFEYEIRTLTIQAPLAHREVIRQAAAAINDSWRGRNYPYQLYLEMDLFTGDDWASRDARHTRLNTQLMAGQGPDIFWFDDHNIHGMIDNGFLADIYTLIDQDPYFAREDFFTNVLSAIELSGGLYMLPISFGFDFMSINTRVPQSFINRFAQYPNLTYTMLADLYMDIVEADFEAFGNMHFGFFYWNILSNAISQFINFNEHTANHTDPHFIAYMNSYMRLMDINSQLGATGFSRLTDLSFVSQLPEHSRMYMFNYNSRYHAFAFLPFENPYYAHHRPLTDNEGRLLINPTSNWQSQSWATVCITAAGDSVLAWEFIKYLIDAYAHPVGPAARGAWGTYANWGHASLSTPILRSLFREHAHAAFEKILYYLAEDFRIIRELSGEEHDMYIEYAIDRLAAYTEMPVAMDSIPLPIGESVWGPIYYLSHGMITAEEAAQRIQNAISLWLIE